MVSLCSWKFADKLCLATQWRSVLCGKMLRAQPLCCSYDAAYIHLLRSLSFGTRALVIIFSHLGVSKFQEFCNGSSFACLVIIHCALQCYTATKVWSIEKMVPIATSRGLQRERLPTQATHHLEQLLCY